MFTIGVVEDVVKLRDQIKNCYHLSGIIKTVNVPIIYENRNYLTDMETDTQFLQNSKLNGWFNFSDKPDPFLLLPSTPYTTSKVSAK